MPSLQQPPVQVRAVFDGVFSLFLQLVFIPPFSLFFVCFEAFCTTLAATFHCAFAVSVADFCFV